MLFEQYPQHPCEFVKRARASTRTGRWLMGVLAVSLSSACATQGSSQDESPGKQGRVQSALSAGSEAKVMAQARAPKAAIASVRRVGDHYEVEVQSAQGFSPRALDPMLRIGPVEIRGYRESATVGEFGAVFTLSADEFEAIPEGSSIRVGYGDFKGAESFGTLKKSTLDVVK